MRPIVMGFRVTDTNCIFLPSDVLGNMLTLLFTKGRGKKRGPFCSLLLQMGGVGKNAKRLQSFFISYTFFGVFQHDPGLPKYALELRG